MRRLKRKCLLRILLAWPLVIASLAPSVAFAQKLHAVVVGDVSPAAGWGKYTMAVAMDTRLMFAMLNNNLPEHQLNYVPMEIEEDAWSDPQNLLSAINELETRPGDIIVFYFSGHGGADDRGHYLQLARGKLYREELLTAMESKQPRLSVLLTDCCNTRSDGYLYGAPYIHTENPARPTPLFQSLFFEPTGRVDINSSAPGESAFFLPISESEEFPSISNSIFTGELTYWVEENKNRRATWDNLVSAVSLQVHSTFLKVYPYGTSVTKGGSVQKEQNVYAWRYPGLPEAKGPRTGFLIRDFGGRGAVIVGVVPNSPASQVFRLDQDKLVSLSPQQVVVSVNNVTTATTEGVLEAIATAPQIAKLGIRDRQGHTFEVLMRMRY